MRRSFLIFASSCLLLAGCDLIDYHPYDVHITGEKNVNAHNIEKIEAACKGKTTLRFVTMGDSQRWYDETRDFVNDVNKRGDIDFVIHGGDLSDFGVTKEFIWQRDIMNKLNMPYVVIFGNHDHLATGQEAFKAIFGKENFSFIAGDVKFVCLNTNALEYDYSEPIPNFSYMESEVTSRADEFSKTVVSMHAGPYTEQFNNNAVIPFHEYVKKFPGIQFCTAAHTHSFKDATPFGDDIHYVTSDAMKKRTYLLFTITPDTYTYELVEY